MKEPGVAAALKRFDHRKDAPVPPHKMREGREAGFSYCRKCGWLAGTKAQTYCADCLRLIKDGALDG